MPRPSPRSTASRLLSARQVEEERKLAAALSPRAEKPEEPQDHDKSGDEHEEGDYDTESEDKEKKDDEEETEGEAESSAQIPNNAAGDRAAERDPVISSHRDCERARIAAILRSPEAKLNKRAAEAFALDSAMPRDQAIAMLKAVGPEARSGHGLNERMSNVPRVGPGAPQREVTQDDRKATALAIVNAGRKTRGEEPLAQLPA